MIANIFHPNNLATSQSPPENWSEQPASQTEAATSSQPSTLQSTATTKSPASSDGTGSSAPLSGRVLGASTAAPIIERIVETVPQIPGVTPEDFAALEARINTRINGIVSPPQFPQEVAGNGNGSGVSYNLPPAAQRIDQLSNVTITNPTIIGGSLSGILHTTRDVVVQGAANDNLPLPVLSATGTDATSTAQ